MLADFVRARPLFYGDYYPLLANSPDYDVWAAFQMHRPDLGEGLMLAFRRKDAPLVASFCPGATSAASRVRIRHGSTKWHICSSGVHCRIQSRRVNCHYFQGRIRYDQGAG
jgi:hypothetical protein